MPAMLDDPTSSTIYRRSGIQPFPDGHTPVPTDITLQTVTLRDGTTKATLVPYGPSAPVPAGLQKCVCDAINREIKAGDTYPVIDPMEYNVLIPYWFANFAAVMLRGEYKSHAEVVAADAEGRDWTKEFLGTFYIKPNYPGRSSHICNAGFLVSEVARNQGVGRLLGEAYLQWAPKLGYIYSVFNLVYETNVASCRIWDGLAFDVIGRVPGCGNLKSYPGKLIDAIIYGRDLVKAHTSDQQ